MKTIGVDLHKDSMTIAVMNEGGEIERRETIPTKCRGRIVEFFASYGLQCQAVVESVGFYAWFWDLVQPLVGRMVLANAPEVKKLRPYGKAKTDPIDAAFLAQLLYEHRLPTAFAPPPDMRQLRTLVRIRCHVARSLAAARRLLRWVSLQTNLPGPNSLTSDRAQKWILACEPKLSPAQRSYARTNLDQIIQLERQETELDRQIADFLSARSSLLHQAELLQSIPGIGPLAAATILGETAGTDRFPDSGRISSFAGLVPRVNLSGQGGSRGAVTKAGPPLLRWVLQQAAWVAYRCDAQARRIICRIARRTGQKKAVTAYARKLLTYARSVLHRNQPFAWPDSASATVPVPQPKEGAWCFDI